MWKPTAKFFIVPIREGRCRIITAVPIFTRKWIPNWLTHIFVSRLFIGDLFLHDSERTRAEGKDKYYEPTLADESSRGWNRWHKKFGFANAPPHTFGKASIDNLQKQSLTRREQEDQYLLHTYACNECRSALRMFRRIRNISGFIVTILTSMILQQLMISKTTMAVNAMRRIFLLLGM